MKNYVPYSTYFHLIITAEYVKLQDAYVAETGAIGSWGKIGYAIPGSSSFTYSDPTEFTNDETTLVGALGDDEVIHWQGVNNTKLNDCAVSSKWQIKLSAAEKSSQGMIDYSAGVDGEVFGQTAAISGKPCMELTPNFKNLSSK